MISFHFSEVETDYVVIWTDYVVRSKLKDLIFLPPIPYCWDDKHSSPN